MGSSSSTKATASTSTAIPSSFISSSPMNPSLELQSSTNQQIHQKQTPRRVSEWNNGQELLLSSVSIKPLQQQQPLEQQQNVASTLHQCLSSEFGINMKMIGERRCSLGF